MIYNLRYKYHSKSPIVVDVYNSAHKLIRTDNFFLSLENLLELNSMDTFQKQQAFLIELLKNDYFENDIRNREIHFDWREHYPRKIDEAQSQSEPMLTYFKEYLADLQNINSDWRMCSGMSRSRSKPKFKLKLNFAQIIFPIRSCVGITFDNELNSNINPCVEESTQRPFLFFLI